MGQRVKTIKRIFKKCREDKSSEQIALLNFNNTPSEGIGLSTSQRLFGRRCRTMLPIQKSLLKTRHETDKEKIAIKRSKDKQAKYYNEQLNPSEQFEIGDTVRIKKSTDKRRMHGND